MHDPDEPDDLCPLPAVLLLQRGEGVFECFDLEGVPVDEALQQEEVALDQLLEVRVGLIRREAVVEGFDLLDELIHLLLFLLRLAEEAAPNGHLVHQSSVER
jgi:hypothetical protein